MKIEVNLSKNSFLLFASLIFIITAAFVVSGIWDTAKSVWHSGSDVKVRISGTDYSLQEAIDEGLISKEDQKCMVLSHSQGHSCGIAGKKGLVRKVQVPSFCMHPNTCMIGGFGRSIAPEYYFYSQYDEGHSYAGKWGKNGWEVPGFTFPENPVNGDSVSTEIVLANTPGDGVYVKLFDDTPDDVCPNTEGNPSLFQGENSPDYWSVVSYKVDGDDPGFIVVCPLKDFYWDISNPVFCETPNCA